jgi:transcriptional regulator with XRE-family HTH domain
MGSHNKNGHDTLRAWRAAHGYTLADAARVLGVSVSGYFYLERGQRVARPATMKRIHERTGVPVAVLARVA